MLYQCSNAYRYVLVVQAELHGTGSRSLHNNYKLRVYSVINVIVRCGHRGICLPALVIPLRLRLIITQRVWYVGSLKEPFVWNVLS